MSRTPTKKPRPDYLEAYVKDAQAKYVSDHIIKGRRICMRGLQVCVVQEDGKGCHLDPVIPALSPAIRLLKTYPGENDITWTGKKWRLSR